MRIEENQKKYATIKEVAKRAGVSVATVSRVLNNQLIVREEKIRKVLKVINELNYIPNPAARFLGKKELYKIAIIINSISDITSINIMKGIFKILKKNEIDIILFDSDNNYEIEKSTFLNLSKKLIEGAIFIGQCGEELDFTQISKRIPIVIINRSEELETVDSFIIDESESINKIIEYLYKLNHKNIAYISGPINNYFVKLRFNLYKKALKRKNLFFIEKYHIKTDLSIKGGSKGFDNLLKTGHNFTSIICDSDLITIGAAINAIKKGYDLKKDFYFIGYDSDETIKYFFPEITILNCPGYKIGTLASELIVSKIRKQNKSFAKKNIFKTKLNKIIDINRFLNKMRIKK